MFLGNLIDGLHPSQGFQTHLRLELRQVHVAFLLLFTHLDYPFLSTVSYLNHCPKFRVHFMHTRTRGGKYGEAVAIGILIPVRPEEISNQVRVKLDDSGAMQFEVKGSKLRKKGSGIAAQVEGIGQPMRWITLMAVDPIRLQTFNWLRDQVVANGGSLTVGKGLSASGICSAFRSMSGRLFDRSESPPSFYALRHAACAELKASGIGEQAVAQGMGHASVLSQKAYGTRSQGSGKLMVMTEAIHPVRQHGPQIKPPSFQRNNATQVTLSKAGKNKVCSTLPKY